MFRHILLIFVFVALADCAYAPPLRAGSAVAWDGLGRDPNLRVQAGKHEKKSAKIAADGNAERERVLARLRPYSEAWWAVHDEIEAANDRQINSTIVICQGCFQSPSERDVTGSLPSEGK